MSYQLMAWASEQRLGSPAQKAVLLALANIANHQSGQCHPSVDRLAWETEFSEATVKRALKDLTDRGIIVRKRRRREDGSLGTYDYEFPKITERANQRSQGHLDPEITVIPQEEPGSRSSNQEEPPVGPPRRSAVVVTRRGWSVDHQKVTEDEEALARAVLKGWNLQAGQELAAQSWLAKIVMRVREHPKLSLADHNTLIASALANPWWKGPATPSVIYGNGAQFERQMLGANGSRGSPGSRELAGIERLRRKQERGNGGDALVK